MKLRPLNDTVIIEADHELVPVDTDQSVLDSARRGLILIPEKNTMMKIPNTATIVSYGPQCWYKFKPGQRIIYGQFDDKPYWIEEEGKLYRIIKYHNVRAVYEDAE